jgi:hypothetical protein
VADSDVFHLDVLSALVLDCFVVTLDYQYYDLLDVVPDPRV